MHSPREPEKADVDYLLEAAALQRSVSYVRAQEGKLMPVSYTHLDVYKRQIQKGPGEYRPCVSAAAGGHLIGKTRRKQQ